MQENNWKIKLFIENKILLGTLNKLDIIDMWKIMKKRNDKEIFVE